MNMNRISLALTSFAILMVLTLALLVTAPVVAQAGRQGTP